MCKLTNNLRHFTCNYLWSIICTIEEHQKHNIRPRRISEVIPKSYIISRYPMKMANCHLQDRIMTMYCKLFSL